MAVRKPLVVINGEISEKPPGDSLDGVGGSQQVFVQQTQPSGDGPWIWFETDSGGVILDFVVADGIP